MLNIQKILASSNQNNYYLNILNEVENSLQNILANNEPIYIKDLDINGNDLKNLGISKGLDIGKILNELIEIVLKNPEYNTKSNLTKKALEIFSISNKNN